MDKVRSNKGVGLVRARSDGGVEELVPVNGKKQTAGLSTDERRSMDHDSKLEVEVLDRTASSSGASGDKLRAISHRIKHAKLGKISDKGGSGWTEPKITTRKILQTNQVECSLMGNLHRVKMIQFTKLKMNGMILIKATQEELGIIKHSVTLFRGIWASRKELLEVWRLKDTKDSSSLSDFDASSSSYKIMNILIWNCRGAMKPQFRKTVMDLVDWHSPILMVIIETRMSGARADEIIEALPFDGYAVADTIGFAGGIWML